MRHSDAPLRKVLLGPWQERWSQGAHSFTVVERSGELSSTRANLSSYQTTGTWGTLGESLSNQVLSGTKIGRVKWRFEHLGSSLGLFSSRNCLRTVVTVLHPWLTARVGFVITTGQALAAATIQCLVLVMSPIRSMLGTMRHRVLHYNQC
jgi:hypothetical protein